jgi:CheY-like chemotaxis protein
VTLLLFVKQKVILVAEDEPNDRFFINRAFEDCGIQYQVMFVSDGQQAMDYLDGDAPFDDRQMFPAPALLIVDVKMPRRNGFEVVKWVRSHQAWNCLPVLVLSSSSLPQDVQRAYQLNANTYLTKPPSYTLLMKAVEEICDYWFVRSQLPLCGLETPADRRPDLMT